MRIGDLCAALESYLEPEQVREVYHAFLFGAEAHDGQRRASGEPYITHPLAAAHILARQRLDHQTIIAALLHDVIEDTPTAKQQVAEQFGPEVAELVDGVTKLAQVEFASHAEAQAENLRKMMLATARDIRVILVKLADRLHNMRTLGAMPPDKRRRIARETLDIYAPIAQRLGMNALRIELEDLGFSALYPARARVLREAVARARGNRKEVLATIETAISRRLRQEQLEGEVSSREKHLYSLYQKMRAKRLAFHEVLDVYAFRVVVDNVDQCYRVLGVMHNLYKPIPGFFKDYIAIPKANGYQSLHTALKGPFGVSLEVQIRTRDMHTVSESGVAAHWNYKTGGGTVTSAQARAREWLQELLEMQKASGSSQEFIDNLKIDLFPDEVYVFTPKGAIKVLPRGATPVDFAYAVHTGVGNTCVAARVDRRPVPLSTPLANGNTVEIINAPTARPSPVWLKFVATAKARAQIRAYLKNLQQGDARRLGYRLLERELESLGASLAHFPPERVDALVAELGLKSVEALYEDIGLGKRLPLLIARRLAPGAEASAAAPAQHALPILGTEGLAVTLAKCCRPIPGDRITGLLTSGRGVVVHRTRCRNLLEGRQGGNEWVDVNWGPAASGQEYPVMLRVEVANQRGVLATAAAAIANEGCNIENVRLDERDGMTSAIRFVIAVQGRVQLAHVMRRLRALPSVLSLARVNT